MLENGWMENGNETAQSIKKGHIRGGTDVQTVVQYWSVFITVSVNGYFIRFLIYSNRDILVQIFKFYVLFKHISHATSPATTQVPQISSVLFWV